jgi:hypothetical protein
MQDQGQGPSYRAHPSSRWQNQTQARTAAQPYLIPVPRIPGPDSEAASAGHQAQTGPGPWVETKTKLGRPPKPKATELASVQPQENPYPRISTSSSLSGALGDIAPLGFDSMPVSLHHPYPAPHLESETVPLHDSYAQAPESEAMRINPVYDPAPGSTMPYSDTKSETLPIHGRYPDQFPTPDPASAQITGNITAALHHPYPMDPGSSLPPLIGSSVITSMDTWLLHSALKDKLVEADYTTFWIDQLDGRYGPARDGDAFNVSHTIRVIRYKQFLACLFTVQRKKGCHGPLDCWTSTRHV